MAGSKTVFLELALLDLMLGGVTYIPPGIYYIGLSTAAFDPTAIGTAFAEVDFTSTGYARVAVTNDLTEWPAATGGNPGFKSNANDINFPTALLDWGTIESAYLLDDPTTGNALYGADLVSPELVSAADSPTILAGLLIVAEY